MEHRELLLRIFKARAKRRRRLMIILKSWILLRHNLRGPAYPVPRMDLWSLNEETFEHYFRFDRCHFFQVLLPEFRIPDVVITSTRVTALGHEALALVLWRLSYPNRLKDLEGQFGRSFCEISSIVTTTIERIYERFKSLLQWDFSRLNEATLQRYSMACYEKTRALTTCFGFIDGTVRPLCRPIKYQRQLYNGHKRVHAIKFQSIVSPDGVIIHMSGPYIGKRHDARILRESGILEILQQHTRFSDTQYTLYGDPAYPMRSYLSIGFKRLRLTLEEKAFNERMNSARVAVEWSFGKICQYWAFVDFKKNLKVLLQPVGKYYVVASILTNCHTCLYGSVASNFFNCEPPTVHEYLHSATNDAT